MSIYYEFYPAIHREGKYKILGMNKLLKEYDEPDKMPVYFQSGSFIWEDARDTFCKLEEGEVDEPDLMFQECAYWISFEKLRELQGDILTTKYFRVRDVSEFIENNYDLEMLDYDAYCAAFSPAAYAEVRASLKASYQRLSFVDYRSRDFQCTMLFSQLFPFLQHYPAEELGYVVTVG